MEAEIRNTVPEAEALVETGKSRLELAMTLKIESKPDHELGLVLFQELSDWERRIAEWFAAPKAAAHKAHRVLCDRESALLLPIKQAKRTVAERCASFVAEQKRKADEEARRLEAMARKEEEERKLLEAIAAEEAGEPEVATAILEEPVTAPTIAVAPEVANVVGISSRTTWGAEVHDMRALIEYVAANPQWTEILLPNMPRLNGLARTMRAEMRIPGVRAVPNIGLAARR